MKLTDGKLSQLEQELQRSNARPGRILIGYEGGPLLDECDAVVDLDQVTDNDQIIRIVYEELDEGVTRETD